MGDRKRDVGRRQEVGLGPRPKDQQGTGEEGWTRRRPCLGETQQGGALGVGSQGGRHAQAEGRRLLAEAFEHEPFAEELAPERRTVAVAPEPLIGATCVRSERTQEGHGFVPFFSR